MGLRPVLAILAVLLLAGLGLVLWSGTGSPAVSATAPASDPPAVGGPVRVAVIDPGVNEVMVTLGLQDRIVGRPAYTDDMAATVHLPVLGTGINPSYEQVVRQAPDLILTTHASRGVVLENLGKIAPTEALPWLTAEQVVASIRRLGELLHVQGQAGRLADEMAAGLAPSVGADSPRVLILLGAPSESDTDLWVVKPNSLHGAALRAAGGHHAIPQEIAGPPTLSIEGLLQVDPDLIIVMISTADTSPEVLAGYSSFWKRLGMLSAVKEDKVGFLHGQGFFSTGPAILDFKRALSTEIERLQGAR